MTTRVFGAVDVGASSGRVIAALVTDGDITLRTVHRFANSPVPRGGRLRWDIKVIFDEIISGLALLGREFPQLESIGIDTWGVDYGLLDADGNLLADPVSYRDDRTGGVIDEVHRSIGRPELYAINGLQFLPFTTLYQLAAERQVPEWEQAAHVVLLPDLFCYWLTGVLGTELTNASTTGLLNARTGTWSAEILHAVGLGEDMLPPLRRAGTVLGPLSENALARTGLRPSVLVTTVASHDTASAVAALPSSDRRNAYISSGTWSLVGTELDRPLLSEETRIGGFTNERGVGGRIRFLRNVGGLWILQESLRNWSAAGTRLRLTSLLQDAAALRDGGPLIDVDDPTFLAPGNMPERVRAAVDRQGQSPPMTPAATVRCILASLATAHASAIDRLAALCDLDIDTIHVMGGGSQNALLCQLTAQKARRPVEAGPAEATALGNAIVQAMASGALPGELDEVRQTVARAVPRSRYEPGAL